MIPIIEQDIIVEDIENEEEEEKDYIPQVVRQTRRMPNYKIQNEPIQEIA